MKISRLRNKLLLSVIAISMAMMLSSMLAMSWIIAHQYQEQSDVLLKRAAGIIQRNLDERKENILLASRQLATQKNLGSTIWYLTKYGRSNIDREMLSVTYLQLARDTYKIGKVAKLSRIAIYNSTGDLVSFAMLNANADQAGFARFSSAPAYHVATLKGSGEISRANMLPTNNLPGMSLHFDGVLPSKESAHYAVIDGALAIESHVPIMGVIFNSKTGKQEMMQLGLVVSVQAIGQDFAEYLGNVTDVKINVFSPKGFAGGNMPTYLSPDWSGIRQDAQAESAKLNEIKIEGKGFNQILLPLYSGTQQIGIIAGLNSEAVVEKNTREMIFALGMVALASLLLIFPVVLFFANSISRPLTVLSRILLGVATDKQNGTLGDELRLLDKDKNRHDELGILTLSFISMNDAVNQKIQQINELNASLEHTVNERTAALVAKEQESRTLIENSPDTIARYDSECRRIYVNRAFGVRVDGGVAALLGTTPVQNPGSENSEIYEAKIRQVFATGKNAQFELKWAGKDGKEICSHIRLTAELDMSGKIISVLAVGRDITELNNSRNELAQAAVALQKNESLLMEAQSIAGLGNFVLDVNSGMWKSSLVLERLFGIDESYGHSLDGFFALIHPDCRKEIADFVTDELIAKGAVFDKEFRIIRFSDQAERWLHAMARLERDAQGRPVSIRGTAQDVTDRKQAMFKLEDKELAKTRFLAAAGHDLRQPLAAANLFIDALQFTQTSPEQNQIIRRLEQAMKTFNELLDALLNISKLDAGVIVPEYTSIHVTELMNWVELNFSSLAAEKHLGFKLYFPMRERLIVRSDIGLVKSVLMNLVSNAIKFTSKGSILVSARRRGNNVLFQVWDTGMGIQGENIERIFDEFYQANNPQRDRALGLGLGLSIARRALTLLKAEIACRSKLGHGTVFEFALPFEVGASALTQQAPIAIKQDDWADIQFVRGKRFVVVEDDTLVAQALTNLLKGMGCEVRCFHNAEEALHHSNIEYADCYIADYMLGGTLNGMQFLTQLRQKLGRPVAAVLLTGDTSAQTLRDAEGLDWPMLHKPINSMQLIAILRMQMDSEINAL